MCSGYKGEDGGQHASNEWRMKVPLTVEVRVSSLFQNTSKITLPAWSSMDSSALDWAMASPTTKELPMTGIAKVFEDLNLPTYKGEEQYHVLECAFEA